MTIEEIQNIIFYGESKNVEFKSTFNTDAIISICAFSNNNGGKLIVGVSDSGNIVGAQVNQEIIKDWINQIKNLTQPSLIPEYEILELNLKQIVVFKIGEFPIKPVSVRGRYYKRVGASNHQLTTDEIVEFRLTSLNISFDSFFVETEYSELDKYAIETFIKKAEQAGRFNFTGEIKLNFEKLGFLNRGKLTRAAELLWENHKTAIHIGRFKTPETIIDDIVIRSPLIVAVDFDDKIQFSNPGGLIGNLSLEDLLTDNYQAKHRNRLLAEAFYLTGEVEKYGTGFIRIRKSLESYPELAINIIDLSDFFRVELLTKDVIKDVTKDGNLSGVKDGGLNGVKSVRKDVGKELKGKSLKILEIITQNPEITIPEIGETVGLTERSTMRHISTLKKGKYIKREGGRKDGFWRILKNE